MARAVRSGQRVTLEDIDALPSADNIESATAEALVLAQLGTLIRRLPQPDMQVILLWLEGESAADIAEITGLSPGAVHVRVHRIKALLARHFHLPDQTEPRP